MTQALQQKGLKLGVKRAYGDTFDRLRANLNRVDAINAEIQTMLGATFRQLNAEHGFSLQVPSEPAMSGYVNDLNLVERGHLQYLGIGNAFRLAQPEFADRLIRALASRLRMVNEMALSDVELWSKSAAAQLDAQLRERRRNFTRRIEAIDRIQQASGGLNDRIGEIGLQESALNQLDAKLLELTGHLMGSGESAQAGTPKVTRTLGTMAAPTPLHLAGV